jgi:acetyl-CoA C-acetyltransferase/acetyl-CoA acyltransferase
MNPVYFIAGQRIPFVKAGTDYAQDTPLTLSAPVMQAMAGKARPDAIVWGQVIPSLTLSNLAREAALDAGLDPTIPAWSTQLACATSVTAAIQAAGMVGHGGMELIMAGGVELMSRSPIGLAEASARRLLAGFAADPAGLPQALSGLSLADFELPKKGWANRISGRSMGNHMEETAKLLNVAREHQDRIALASHHNAAAAQARSFFSDLLVPYGGAEQDGLVRADTSAEKLASLKPAFDPAGGTLTAGNSSPLTDGAAGLWVATDTGRDRLGAHGGIAARLIDFELAAVDFRIDGMLMAPAYAIPRLLARHGLVFGDIDLWEIHEAFAAQVLANVAVASDSTLRAKHAPGIGDLGAFPFDRINPNGGSLAIGHPFGATGARIISQAVKELGQMRLGAKAVVSVCADGGQGAVLLIERA